MDAMTTGMLVVTMCLFLIPPATVPGQADKPDAQAPEMPPAAGVYYRPGQADWIKLARIVPADARTRGMERYIDTDGYSVLDMMSIFRGAQSEIQIRDRKPVFHVRKIGAARDALIVQLTRKSDRREIRSSSIEVASDNRGGFKKADIRRVRTTALTKDSFTVTPEESLKPGEYLLVFGDANNGFDFSISPGKK